MRPRFEPDPPTPDGEPPHESVCAAGEAFERPLPDSPGLKEMQREQPSLAQSEFPLPDASWKREVASKVSKYRTRRRSSPPRYPSLQLKFESPEFELTSATAHGPATSTSRLSVARSLICVENEVEASVAPVTPTEPAAKILEFPRSTGTPQVFFDELAEPVFERPRILDVPDQLPPPPALGGILIEPAEEPATDKRPGLETPLQPARLSQRLLATAIDAALVGLAFTLFAFIFFRITSSIPRVIAAAGVAAMVFVVFWFGYQYFLMVCSGTTPGLKMARLRVTRFDGKPVSRKGRRWRVLASVLSGLSLGLGYIWFLLDEDQLCWHDRITHTYIAPN